jgi:hypothetical protein
MGDKANVLEIARLEQLYAAGLQDNFVDEALRKIISRQIERDEMDLLELNANLAEYESLFRLSSDEFHRKYSAGQMEDTADFMAWNASVKSRKRLRSRLKILRGENGSID